MPGIEGAGGVSGFDDLRPVAGLSFATQKGGIDVLVIELAIGDRKDLVDIMREVKGAAPGKVVGLYQ